MSTSSSSSSHDGGDGGNGGGGGGEFDEPPHARQRFNSGVWPEPFLEALASQIAIDSALTDGRLAAAPALFNIFQVCRTWRTVSQSDLLWQTLTRRIWRRNHLLHPTWYEEYIYRHRTTRNFRDRRYIYNTLNFPPNDNNNNNNNNEILSCRRLALSDYHLAAGFSDGSVRLFHLPTRHHVSTFHPLQRNHLGPFSRTVCGIFFTDNRLVFASHDGDIHVASINVPGVTRRAYLGDVVTDGVLVDFAGCNQWWVGLYAGVPNRAFHVRNGNTEELVFIGGTLTDPDAVIGWHLLTDLTEHVGRIRITNDDLAVGFTRSRVIVFDLRSQVILGEVVRQISVGAADAYDGALVFVNSRGVANVRQVGSLQEICRFMARGGSLGCMNGGYGFMCIGGGIRVWELNHGAHLYILRERIGDATALIADERYVAACTNDHTIHLWDFGARD
uniref:transcriptional regulator STERILE APETALA n=1 Tax=Erigeron canadensis TaxID=72917 RepID=UPI001CB99C4A|nr:transcriptional regulator STERILE APETALA [Erigeron canadensis]